MPILFLKDLQHFLNIIENYKVIAHNPSIQKNDEGLSHSCEKSALCDNFK